MKNLKLYGALFLALSAGVAFTACHDDDDNTSNPSLPTVGTTGKRLTKVDECRFYYDENGRLKRIRNDDWEVDLSVSYSPFKIEEKGEEMTWSNFSFNGDGYITGLKYRDDYDSWTYSLSYDSDGHLTKMTIKGSDDWTDYFVLTWQDGKLMKAEASEIYDDDDDILYWNYTYTYDNAVENPLKQPSQILYHFIEDEALSPLSYLGYLGVGSSYLPTNQICDSNIDDDFSWGLDATLNEDETIHSEILLYYPSYGYEWRYTYENEDETRAAESVSAAKKVARKMRHHRHRSRAVQKSRTIVESETR